MKTASGELRQVISRTLAVPFAFTVKSVIGSVAAQSCDGCAAVCTTSFTSLAYFAKILDRASRSRMSAEKWVYLFPSRFSSLARLADVDASSPKNFRRMSLSIPTTSRPLDSAKNTAASDPIRPADPVTMATLIPVWFDLVISLESERNTPARLYRNFQTPFEARLRRADDVLVVGVVIDAHIGQQFAIAEPRRAAQPNTGHAHHHAAEHPGSRGVVGGLREGYVVTTLALPPVRGVQSHRCTRNQSKIQPQPEFVVVTETPAEPNAEDSVFLSRILVVVRQVRHPRIRGEPLLVRSKR